MNLIGATDAERDRYLKDFKGVTSKSLINTFLELEYKYLRNINLTMIFDSFDKVAGDYPTYQQHIYSLLKDQFNILISISDPKVIENPTLLDSNSDIINVSYSTDLEIVKQILDNSLISEEMRLNRLDLRYRLRFILSDEAIKRLIIETKGNIVDMKNAIYFLYNEIVLYGVTDYEKVLFQFVQEEINYNPIIKGYVKPERCLRIV